MTCSRFPYCSPFYKNIRRAELSIMFLPTFLAGHVMLYHRAMSCMPFWADSGKEIVSRDLNIFRSLNEA
jgi:hypothetical protein